MNEETEQYIRQLQADKRNLQDKVDKLERELKAKDEREGTRLRAIKEAAGD